MRIKFCALLVLSPAILSLLLAMGGKSVSVPVIPNECIVEGRVVEYAIVSSRLLGISPDQTLYRLVITVQSTANTGEGPNFLSGKEEEDIAFIAKEELSPQLFGKRIQAKAMYAGDERGGRFWISNIEILK